MILAFLGIAGFPFSLSAQNKAGSGIKPHVIVYYFHPSDRCPIDQAIEENSGKTVQSYFPAELKSGVLKFQVLNTDDAANAKVVSNFDINAQALYLVRIVQGKESKTDLTKFAFDFGKSNPGKFKSGLKEKIENALK